MFNKIILKLSILGMVCSIYADQKSNELVLLPHPGEFFRTGKVSILPEQKKRIINEVKRVYEPSYETKIQEILSLEKSVQTQIAQGKTKNDIKDTLDTVAKLKREAIDIRIDALNHMQKILTKEQWEAVNRLTYN